MKSRNLLALGLATALLASCGNGTKNQSEHQGNAPENKGPETSYTMTVNKEKLTWIQDVPGEMKQGKQTFPSIPDSLFEATGCKDGIPSSMSCFLLEAEGEKVLFDAGLGKEGSLLIPTLKSMGISPEDLKYIYITHLHGDHIGNLVKDGKMVFPNAKLYLNKVENDAWRAMEQGNEAQVAMLDIYKDNLVLFNAGDTLPAGVVSMEAYGHTPGHTIFQKGLFLVVGDIMHGLRIQLSHPEYSPKWDMDPETATESRKRVIEMAKRNGLIMAGMHFPANGFESFAPDLEFSR